MKKKNVTAYEALEISKEFIEQPLFNKVIITLNSKPSEDALELSDNIMDEVQYVIAKGINCTQIDVADKVRIDLNKLMVKSMNPNNTHEDLMTLNLDPIEFEGNVFAIIEDRFIKTKFNAGYNIQTNE